MLAVAHPLSNLELEFVFNRFPGFAGVFSRDTIPSNESPSHFGIVNYAKHDDPGTHWVCFYDNMFFDSYGEPPGEEIRRILGNSMYYNDVDYQLLKSITCGYFSVW